jgi:hypothetical protein
MQLVIPYSFNNVYIESSIMVCLQADVSSLTLETLSKIWKKRSTQRRRRSFAIGTEISFWCLLIFHALYCSCSPRNSSVRLHIFSPAYPPKILFEDLKALIGLFGGEMRGSVLTGKDPNKISSMISIVPLQSSTWVPQNPKYHLMEDADLGKGGNELLLGL